MYRASRQVGQANPPLGKSKREVAKVAMRSRQKAMTAAGAVLRRTKMAAKETEVTPMITKTIGFIGGFLAVDMLEEYDFGRRIPLVKHKI